MLQMQVHLASASGSLGCPERTLRALGRPHSPWGRGEEVQEPVRTRRRCRAAQRRLRLALPAGSGEGSSGSGHLTEQGSEGWGGVRQMDMNEGSKPLKRRVQRTHVSATQHGPDWVTPRWTLSSWSSRHRRAPEALRGLRATCFEAGATEVLRGAPSEQRMREAGVAWRQGPGYGLLTGQWAPGPVGGRVRVRVRALNPEPPLRALTTHPAEHWSAECWSDSPLPLGQV